MKDENIKVQNHGERGDCDLSLRCACELKSSSAGCSILRVEFWVASIFSGEEGLLTFDTEIILGPSLGLAFAKCWLSYYDCSLHEEVGADSGSLLHIKGRRHRHGIWSDIVLDINRRKV